MNLPDGVALTPRRVCLALACAPCLLLALAVWLQHILVRFPADPDYAYLLNGVNILELASPGQVNHPGTAMHILMALIIGIAWLVRVPFFRFLSPGDDVLLHPELYLWVINLVLACLCAAALLFLGWRLYRATGSLAAALVAQFSLFTAGPAITYGVTYVMPENLLLVLSILLAGAVAPLAFSPLARPSSLRQSIWIGIILGAALATKTSSLPLFGVVLLLRGWGARTMACCSAGLAAIALTSPIMSRYDELLGFNLSLLTHSGVWGQGTIGLPPLNDYLGQLHALYTNMPQFYLSLAACAVVFTVLQWTRGPDHYNLSRVTLVCCLILFAQLAIVAKLPLENYLVPIAGILCLTNGAIALALLQGDARRRTAGGLSLLLLMTYSLWHGQTYWIARLDSFNSQEGDNVRLLESAAIARSGCTFVHGYINPTIGYKLKFGDRFARGFFDQRIRKLYPDFVFYDDVMRRLETAQGDLVGAQVDDWVAKQKCVYLASGPLERFTPEEFGFRPGTLTLVARTHHAHGSLVINQVRLPTNGAPLLVPRQ
jgi:hypothetical protein